MHVGVFQAFPGRGGLQGPPGGRRGPKTITNMVLNEECARRVPPKPRTRAGLKFHAGWSGWTRQPTMAGGGGSAQAETCVEGAFEGT